MRATAKEARRWARGLLRLLRLNTGNDAGTDSRASVEPTDDRQRRAFTRAPCRSPKAAGRFARAMRVRDWSRWVWAE